VLAGVVLGVYCVVDFLFRFWMIYDGVGSIMI